MKCNGLVTKWKRQNLFLTKADTHWLNWSIGSGLMVIIFRTINELGKRKTQRRLLLKTNWLLRTKYYVIFQGSIWAVEGSLLYVLPTRGKYWSCYITRVVGALESKGALQANRTATTATTSLKSIRAVSNFVAVISSRPICQMYET